MQSSERGSRKEKFLETNYEKIRESVIKNGRGS